MAVNEKQINNETPVKQVEVQLKQRFDTLQVIYHMTDTVNRATDVQAIYDEALRSLQLTLGADRAAVVLLDGSGVMRFEAWHELSDSYRRAVEGRTPWTPTERDPQPILIPSVHLEASLEPVRAAILNEGIGALGYIPLVHQGQLLGQYMIYYNEPHAFTEEEAQLARTIASHVAFAIVRKRDEEALQRAYDELEQRVALRTIELSNANRALKRQVTRRKQTMEQLERSEMLLAEAQHVARLGSWEWDPINDRIAWSDELYRIYGLEPGKFMPSYEEFIALVHPEDRAALTEKVQAAYTSKQPFELYHRIMRPDGTVRILHGRGQPVLNEAGDVIRMYGTGQDVTEQRQTEVALRQSEERYHALARHMPDTAVFLFDDDLTLTLVEGAGVIDPELAQKQLEGTSILDVLTLAEESRELGGYYRYADALQGISHVTEKSYRGRIFLIYTVPLWDEQDQLFCGMALVHDITPLKQAQAKLAHSIEQLEALNEMGQAVAASLDLDIIFERVLASLSSLLRAQSLFVVLLEESEFILAAVNDPAGKNLIGTSGPADGGVAGEVLHTGRALWLSGEEVGQRLSSEIERITDYRPLALLAAPLRLHGEIIGVIEAVHSQADAFNRDDFQSLESAATWTAIAIGNARQHEKLQRLFDQVRAGRERLRHLTKKVVSVQEEERQRISRELHDEAGQALTALKISLDMTKSSLPPAMDSVRESLGQAVVLTDETMESIRLLARDLRPAALDTLGLNTTLEGLCRDFTHRTQLTIEYEGVGLPTLPEPATISLYRFVQEALTNVAKHANASKVHVVLRRDSGMISVSVTDNGRGFKVEENTSLPAHSDGIGLIGMHERFELLRGRLEIDSKPGMGTRLTAQVPFQGDESIE